MRILAIFSFSCSAAIFLCNYLLPQSLWLLLGVGMVVLMVLGRYVLRIAEKVRLVYGLVCGGFALGLLWMSAFTAIWIQSAQKLDGQTIPITATVLDFPQEVKYGRSVVVRVDSEGFATWKTLLYLNKQEDELRPGDRISATARCSLADHTSGGEAITYYTAKGIFLRGTVYGELEVERPERISPRYWPVFFAKSLKNGIDSAFSADSAPLIRALVTGNRDNLTDEFTSSLERTGLSHVVAVSGMHLAFLSGVISFLLGVGKRRTAVLSLLWVVLFCGVAGNTPSVLRAGIMIALLQLAPLLGRERDDITALAFALMVLLLWNPLSATHLGLQLSFGAVAGIFLLSEKLQSWMLKLLRLEEWPERIWLYPAVALGRFVAGILSATLGASVTLIPLTVIHFQRFSLISPLSNLLTMWAIAVLFVGGLTTGTVGIFYLGLAQTMAEIMEPLVRYVQFTVDGLAQLPLASIDVVSPYFRFWVVFLCAIVFVMLYVKGRVRPWLPAGVVVLTFALTLFLTRSTFRAEGVSVVALDVGQGQSVLFQTNHCLTVVDCGGSRLENAGNIAANHIKSAGQKKIDLLVVTHFHADHANGVRQLLERMKVKTIAVPQEGSDSELGQEILALAEKKGVEVWVIEEDTAVALEGEQEITIYAPLRDRSDLNELGLAVLATSGDFDVLLTGDMNGEGERCLLAHTALPDVEVLMVGHHGSRYSTTEELLQAIQPESAVISVGAGNSYGHPTQETLERLSQSGANIYRTDLLGTVTVQGK